jgi:hypothetical protein
LLCFSVVNIINLLLHNSTILPLSIMLLQLNSTWYVFGLLFNLSLVGGVGG